MADSSGWDTNFITTPLESHHDRAAFSCGKPSPDNYLRDRALPDAKGFGAITFVLQGTADQHAIQGYYSLSSTSIEFGAIPARIAKQLRISRHRTMSATLIGRSAVSTACQGQRIGEALLFDALAHAYQAAQQIIVHALDEDAERYYQRHGRSIRCCLAGLYLPTATVKQLLR